MQQEIDTLEDVVEPYLLYEGFILRTPWAGIGDTESVCAFGAAGHRAANRPSSPCHWKTTALSNAQAELLPSADLEDLGSADRAGALGRGATILHGDLLGVLDLALGLALHAVASSHG